MATVPSGGVKKQRQLPPSVLQAKLNNDTAALSCLGQIGARKQAQMRAAKKTREAEVAAAANQLAEELILEDHRATVLAGAYAHAQRNRIGWDDDCQQ